MHDADILERRIRPLVTADLLARARARPNPPYDPDIVEVMDFVRRNPDPELPRYAIVRVDDGFAVAVRRRPPGESPAVSSAERYPDRGAAENAVFVQRLRDVGLVE